MDATCIVKISPFNYDRQPPFGCLQNEVYLEAKEEVIILGDIDQTFVSQYRYRCIIKPLCLNIEGTLTLQIHDNIIIFKTNSVINRERLEWFPHFSKISLKRVPKSN